MCFFVFCTFSFLCLSVSWLAYLFLSFFYLPLLSLFSIQASPLESMCTWRKDADKLAFTWVPSRTLGPSVKRRRKQRVTETMRVAFGVRVFVAKGDDASMYREGDSRVDVILGR